MLIAQRVRHEDVATMYTVHRTACRLCRCTAGRRHLHQFQVRFRFRFENWAPSSRGPKMFAGSDCVPQALAPGADVQKCLADNSQRKCLCPQVSHICMLDTYSRTLFTELQVTALERNCILISDEHGQLAHYALCQALAICHALQLVWEHLPPEALSSEFHHEAIIQPDLDATFFNCSLLEKIVAVCV